MAGILEKKKSAKDRVLKMAYPVADKRVSGKDLLEQGLILRKFKRKMLCFAELTTGETLVIPEAFFNMINLHKNDRKRKESAQSNSRP